MKSENIPKILICCPTSDVKDYCFDKWARHVRSFSYPNVKVFMSDNSKSGKYHKKITSFGFKTKRVNPKGKHNIQFICESMNQCRDYFLEGDFTHALWLESDVFPTDLDFIQKLLDHDVAIATIPYHIGEGEDSHLCLQYGSQDPTGMFTSPLVEGSDLLFIDGNLKTIAQAGLGCALIRRSVLEKLSFKFHPQFNAHPDTWFASDCMANKIPIYCDTSMICVHKNKPWKNGEQVK